MTAFVILAAGKGTRIGRVGEHLHKALVPLGRQAVLSHILERRPPNSRVIICVGHRAAQIREFMAAAHPSIPVEFVDVPGYDQPGAGPGASLLAAKDIVGEGEDMAFTTCDTLWGDTPPWDLRWSWAGVAPIPPGTDPKRWCLISDSSPHWVYDKPEVMPPGEYSAYIGTAFIKSFDLATFWAGVNSNGLVTGERQVSGGLKALPIEIERMVWTDVGDAEAYHRAVVRTAGYDFTKVNEATYILPKEGRVVKWFANRDTLHKRCQRGLALAAKGAVSPMVHISDSMMAYEYVPGISGYDYIDLMAYSPVPAILEWAEEKVWSLPVLRNPNAIEVRQALDDFYRKKTLARIDQLAPDLREIAWSAVQKVQWDRLMQIPHVGVMHGDLNLGNVIIGEGARVWGIDWREDFGGAQLWGDQRYDVAKLLAGCVVHWDRAQKGDFTPWARGEDHARVVRNSAFWTPEVETIAALSLINSAPLHAAPLDAVLVTRGAEWLTYQEV